MPTPAGRNFSLKSINLQKTAKDLDYNITISTRLEVGSLKNSLECNLVIFLGPGVKSVSYNQDSIAKKSRVKNGWKLVGSDA